MSIVAQYTIDAIKELADRAEDGTFELFDDRSLKKWRLIVKLDPARYWFLSVFVSYSGEVISYSLDHEAADDSHYIFVDEDGIRMLLYKDDGDEELYIHEIMLRYMKEHNDDGDKLLARIWPYIIDQYHFSDYDD